MAAYSPLKFPDSHSCESLGQSRQGEQGKGLGHSEVGVRVWEGLGKRKMSDCFACHQTGAFAQMKASRTT